MIQTLNHSYNATEKGDAQESDLNYVQFKMF